MIISYTITNVLYLLTLIIFLRKLLLTQHASDCNSLFQLIVNIIYYNYKLLLTLHFTFHCVIICVLYWKHKPLNTLYCTLYVNFYKLSINLQKYIIMLFKIGNWIVFIFSTNQWHLIYSIYVTAIIRVITAIFLNYMLPNIRLEYVVLLF